MSSAKETTSSVTTIINNTPINDPEDIKNIKGQIAELKSKLKQQNKQKFRQLAQLQPQKFGYLMYENPIFDKEDIMEALINQQLTAYELLAMIKNPNVDLELADTIINNRILPIYQHPENVYHELISNPNLTEKYIEEHPSPIWTSPTMLKLHKNISVAYLRQHNLSIWNSPNLTAADLELEINSGKYVDWKSVSFNSAISFDTVLAYSGEDWDWSHIFSKTNTPADCKQRHPHLPWPNGNRLTGRNYNKPFPSPQEIADKKFAYSELQKYPSLTLDFVLAHHDGDWDWYGIARRNFDYSDELSTLEEQLTQASSS